jgi:hypothetical protein
MIVFDVKCHVLEPIHVTDTRGKEITIDPGYYRLRGLEHLVRSAGAGTPLPGTALTIIGEDDREHYAISAETLANFLAYDEVEVTV